MLDVQDWSGAVLLAYELSRKAALGLLLVHAWRPTGGEGEHRITFEAGFLLAWRVELEHPRQLAPAHRPDGPVRSGRG